jgi:hypothetical protein
MPSSEDYTVVWAGVFQELQADEVAQAFAGVHPLIEWARIAGLDHWCDTFDYSPEGEPVFSLLIGERLNILGHKEGRTHYSLTPEALMETFDRIRTRLEQRGLSSRFALHVLLRIEY